MEACGSISVKRCSTVKGHTESWKRIQKESHSPTLQVSLRVGPGGAGIICNVNLKNLGDHSDADLEGLLEAREPQKMWLLERAREPFSSPHTPPPSSFNQPILAPGTGITVDKTYALPCPPQMHILMVG